MTSAGATTVADLEGALRAHVRAAEGVVDLLPAVHEVGSVLCGAFAAGNRLYAFGNGGSAAEAQHLVAEFVGRFHRTRRALPAVSLTTDPSVVTCIANDFSFDSLFARQVAALAGPGDVVVAFTTSGRSPNVVQGLAAARERGAITVLFGAGDGADAAPLADHLLLVRSDDTARVQEMHLLLLHLLSEIMDRWAEQTEIGTSASSSERPDGP